jgi:succinyl-diaminopimelate desuccinylase
MDVAETAQALVKIPSINPNYDPESSGEEAIVDWLLDWAQRHAVEARTQEVLPRRSNIVFTFSNGASHPHVLWATHTDTVAVSTMTIPPFDGKISEGRLQGRGSADMKGPLASMLHAFLVLRDDASSWKGTLTLVCAIDEEFSARGIKAFLAEQSAFDFAIVAEPSRSRVVRGCKGCLRFTLEARGQAAHSSTPDLGRNAIIAMSEALLEIDRFFSNELSTSRRMGFGSSTGSVGLIQGGTGINIVPESCRASFDIRLLPGQIGEDVYRTIRQRVYEMPSRVRDIEWKFESHPFIDPAFEVEEKGHLVQTALALLNQDKGDLVSYSCDASKISAAGIPCIILGPGDIANAHTADESIGLDELEAGVRVYAELGRKLLPV